MAQSATEVAKLNCFCKGFRRSPVWEEEQVRILTAWGGETLLRFIFDLARVQKLVWDMSAWNTSVGPKTPFLLGHGYFIILLSDCPCVHVKSRAVSVSGEQIDVAHSCMGVHFCAVPCVWGAGIWWWKLLKVLVRYKLQLTKKKKKYDWSCVGEIFVGMVCHLNEKEKKKQLVFKLWGKSLNVFDIEWRKE